MHYFYFASWAKAYNLFDDKWYVYQYIRTSKTYYQQGKKYDKKNQKRNKKTKFSAPEFDVDKWHTCQYHRLSLKLMFQVSFALQKNKPNQKKKQKWQDSPLQDLIPDHGPQHGAVRCSTHWAAGNLSTSKAQYQTYVLGVLLTAHIKPRKVSAIP